jgi:hypothetical protein
MIAPYSGTAYKLDGSETKINPHILIQILQPPASPSSHWPAAIRIVVITCSVVLAAYFTTLWFSSSIYIGIAGFLGCVEMLILSGASILLRVKESARFLWRRDGKGKAMILLWGFLFVLALGLHWIILSVFIYGIIITSVIRIVVFGILSVGYIGLLPQHLKVMFEWDE